MELTLTILLQSFCLKKANSIRLFLRNCSSTLPRSVCRLTKGSKSHTVDRLILIRIRPLVFDCPPSSFVLSCQLVFYHRIRHWVNFFVVGNFDIIRSDHFDHAREKINEFSGVYSLARLVMLMNYCRLSVGLLI